MSSGAVTAVPASSTTCTAFACRTERGGQLDWSRACVDGSHIRAKGEAPTPIRRRPHRPSAQASQGFARRQGRHYDPHQTDRLWIVDGTLIPVRDRKVGASSRNYRFSANVQVIIDADTRLVVATARPAPGNRADAQVWRNSGLAQHCDGVTVLGDGAYINTGLVVPHRKRPGRPLLAGEEEDNAEHRRVRARVEHAFARMKNYKILRDCRQRGDGLHHAVQAVAHMHNLALAA